MVCSGGTPNLVASSVVWTSIRTSTERPTLSARFWISSATLLIVHRVNQMDILYDLFDLVALKVAYEMPPDAFIIELTAFFKQFLGVVLADVDQSCSDRLTHHFCTEGLRDTHKENVFGTTPAPGANLPDAIPNDFYVLRKHFTTFKE